MIKAVKNRTVEGRTEGFSIRGYAGRRSASDVTGKVRVIAVVIGL
jgi:hypothetical protein